MSIGTAVLVAIAPVMPVSFPTASSLIRLSGDSTALLMGGTTVPTWHAGDVAVIMRQFVTPTHPGDSITPVALTTPEEFWPITGVGRLICLALCPPSVFRPGGAAWPNEPWWKLSGLFDLTIDQSIQSGLADLEKSMAAHGNDHLVIYGYSQGAMIAIREKRKLAEQYPAGTAAPDISFVLSEDPNVPNGGLLARFPGFYIPVLDLSFNGPEPTNTQFHTDVITRQYDGLTDFPLYPLNPVADLNALLGVLYVHFYPFDVSLPADPTTSPAYQGTHGDSSYYVFSNPELPLFGPLRTLGVPEPLIDVVEPFFRVLVEAGYDRSIPPWQPTPARLIPQVDPGKLIGDLVAAIRQGVNNAVALVDSPIWSTAIAPTHVAAPGSTGAAPQPLSEVFADKVVTTAAQLDSSKSAPPAEANLPARTAAAATEHPATPAELTAQTGSAATSMEPTAEQSPATSADAPTQLGLEASTPTAADTLQPSNARRQKLPVETPTVDATKHVARAAVHGPIGQPSHGGAVPNDGPPATAGDSVGDSSRDVG